MIAHFRQNKPSTVNTTIELRARAWPRFTNKESIHEEGKLS